MKIAVNIQPLLHSNKSGIGYYQSEILRNMLADNREDEYYLNFFDVDGRKYPLAEPYAGEKAQIEYCRRISATLYQLIWSVVPLPYTLFFRSKPDVSAFFNYYLPPFVRGRRILVVYDTVIKDHPETVRFKTKTMLRLTLKASIKRADRIVTISQFSKGQIIKHFGVEESRISVVPCAADSEKYHPIDKGDARISRATEKYGINGKYFLYLGNLEPRKNIVRLILAYHAAKERRDDLPLLVLAGGKGWLYDEIFRKVGELGLTESVIFTGYVDDGDVPLLMNGAEAFCFPSLYEGFGMPPLEAMSCGTPVIVSDCTSLPEVVGDCGIRVDPCSEEDIAAALIKMCDPAFLEKQREMGIKRAAEFSWKKSAALMRRVMEELKEESV